MPRVTPRAAIVSKSAMKQRPITPATRIGGSKPRHGLARVLSKLGVCSRSQAQAWIAAGRVSVNGRITLDAERPTDAERDRIAVDGEPAQAVARVYIAMNKPRGIVVSADDERERETVYALLRDAGLPLACLTNKPRAFAADLLQAKGLSGYFACVFGGDSFERKKPDPLPLLKTCEALGTAPARTLMVGDSENDGLAARAAGCPVALVTYGYNHGEPIERAPHDRLIASLADLWPSPVGGVA